MEEAKTYSLILIVVFISFLGFITENVFIYFRYGTIDNRNMTLPFLLGYGLTVLTFYKLFGTPSNPLFCGRELAIDSSFVSSFYYFAIVFICISIGELILGHLVERVCGIVWWDYSSIPLSVTKYTSVPTSTLFSLFITFFMGYVFNPMLELLSGINSTLLAVISISLLVLLSIDFINSGVYMLKHRTTLKLWRVDFKRSLKQILIEMKGRFLAR